MSKVGVDNELVTGHVVNRHLGRLQVVVRDEITIIRGRALVTMTKQ